MTRDATRTRENEDELDQINNYLPRRIYLDLAISNLPFSLSPFSSLLPPLLPPLLPMPVPVSSSVKNASTRIVLSQKCQYAYRPQSKMPVLRVSSSVKNASTRIVLSQKCRYAYRPQSKMPVCVSSSVKNASTGIVLSRKCQYPYRPQLKMPVPVSSYQYRHRSHGCSSNGILPVWARHNKGPYA